MMRAATIATLIAAALALAVAGPAAAASGGRPAVPSTKAAAAAPAAGESDIALGSPKASVTVIEYASVTCPHCAAWDRDVFPAFKRKYVDTGKVRYILREFPTDPADWAEAGFMVARCSGPSKYLDVVQAYMASQNVLFERQDGAGWLYKGGAVGGLNPGQIKACLHDEKAAKALEARVEANGKAYNVEGTPTFIVNGKMAGDGELTLIELDAAIAKANAPPPQLRGAQPAASSKPKRKAG